MKIIKFVIISLFVCCQVGNSQDLAYTYPFSFPKLTKDVVFVEVYHQTIYDFDTLNIHEAFKLESEPVSRRYLKDGKLIKTKNVKDSLGYFYHYDKKGNIQSREFIGARNPRNVAYKLDQENLKLTVILNDEIKEEAYFDSLHRVTLRVYHSGRSTRKRVRKTKTTYEDDLITTLRNYTNDSLEYTEYYEYQDEQLKNIKRVGVNGKLLMVQSIKYFPKRTDTKTTWYKSKGTTSSNSRMVEFYDDKGKLIKIFRLSYNRNKPIANITEYRLAFET